MAHLPAHQRCILRRHTGPTVEESDNGEAGLIIGGFTETLRDPWSPAPWDSTAWDRPWVGTRGNLRLDGDPGQVGGFGDAEDGPWNAGWDGESWEPDAFDVPSRINRGLGMVRDGNPVVLGSIGDRGEYRQPRSDPWSVSRWDPRRYDRPWVSQALGAWGDGSPTMIGALPSAKRQGRAVLSAAKALGQWAERNRIPTDKAFLGTGDANAAGWVLHLPSENDRVQALQHAKQLSVVHRTFHNIKGSDLGTGWFLVYFTDDPASELAVLPDAVPSPATAGLSDDKVGLFGKLFKPKAKGLKKKIERLEKKVAKLREQLAETGEGDDDESEGYVGGSAATKRARADKRQAGRVLRASRAQDRADRLGERASGGGGGGLLSRFGGRSGSIGSSTLGGAVRITQPFAVAGGDPVMLTEGLGSRHPFG
jgi:hypothetical protein